MTPEKNVLDEDFQKRIEGALKTAQAWEAHQLLSDCRATIPFDDLRNDDGPYSQKDDDDSNKHSSYSLIFFQRLCRYFQKSMTWIHQPSCPHCCSDTTTTNTTKTQFVRTRGPETAEERNGKASRVEVYQCTACDNSSIPFARYNNPRTLLQTRQGRCGEYANLFGLYCRAVGYHTRYILDVTDHVWVEVCIPNGCPPFTGSTSHDLDLYCMGDGCEAVINEPSMYEKGWGKPLSYVIAVTPTYVMDVTLRYTRQFTSKEFQMRRRAITSSEEAGRHILQQINATLLAKLPSLKQRQAIEKQCGEEEDLLMSFTQLTEWKTDQSYHQGRISGAIEWKMARGETGLSQQVQKEENKDKNTTQQQQQPQSTEYAFQTFLPYLDLSQAYIALYPQPPVGQSTHAIVVSGAPCVMGLPNQLSVVVVDPQEGTILQSKSLVSLQNLEWFIENSILDTKILLVHGRLSKQDEPQKKDDTTTKQILQQRLPLWNSECIRDGGIMYAGIVGQISDDAGNWTVCASMRDTVEPIVLRWNSKTIIRVGELRLRIHRSTRPYAVIGRLPDSSLPLATQVTSTMAQKQAAFVSFIEALSSSPSLQHVSSIVGFSTKPGAPVYLISAKAYPLSPCKDGSDDWVTFVLLPAWLVPASDDASVVALDPVPSSLSYDVPLEANGFVERLGPQLLVSNSQTIDTAVALQRKNPRLIAFYFSAHWCGPCRSFTPMLAAFYQALSEAFPSHGLEIVFVSSDRDQSSFHTYYRTMPWLAVPFTADLEQYKSMLSFQYNIQGIPSLVVLDAVSGAVIVDARTSRGEIQQCCRRGEDGIVEQFGIWLSRLPAESQAILNLLQVSCHETHVTSTVEQDYYKAAMLDKYVYNGTIASLQNGLSRGELCTMDDWEDNWREFQKEEWKIVVRTALQYVSNARREPWNPKFRSFHWSNPVADRISGVLYGLEWWCLQGLEIYASRDDWVAWIPVHLDLDVLHARWSALLDDRTKG